MASSKASLTKQHPAVKLLLRKLQDVSLTGREKPSIVHSSNPVFSQTLINNFRTAYKNARRKLGLLPSSSNDLIDNEAGISPRCTDDAEEAPLKKRKLYSSSDEEDDESDSHSLVDTPKGSFSLMPMVAFSSWIEPRTTTKRLTAAIVLPTGLDINDFSVYVVSNGTQLEFKFKCLWPNEVVNIETLHRKWLLSENGDEKIESYHPKLFGFESFFKGMRNRASDPVQYSCLVPLPFTVETHIHKKSNLQWRNSNSRVVYIELRAQAEQYGIDNGLDTLRLCRNEKY